jgi:M6 family metalloprotease-like protein
MERTSIAPFRIVLSCLLLSGAASGRPRATPIDSAFYYRLTNRFLGPGQSLDVSVGTDGTGRLMMAPSASVSGQLWRLRDEGGGRYSLTTAYLGECFALDVINDGRGDTPQLTLPGNYSGQRWTLTPWGDGSFRLSNDFTGADKSLDVSSDKHVPVLATGDHSGQHWSLSPVGPLPRAATIPPLDPKGDVDKTEGPTDYHGYQRPIGTVRAAMVFVDFPNAPGDADPAAVARHLLGDGKAQQLFREQSYGKLDLQVKVYSGLGWRRIPAPSTSYMHETDPRMGFDAHKTYIAAAASRFSRKEVNFSDYALVFIVAPRGAGFPLSPAFTANPGNGAPTPSGPIRLAVTFGTDSYRNRYINLVHEVGHLFGLPDLYPFGGGADVSRAGCWPIMSDIFHSVSFLGWERHKNGWLDPARILYLPEGDATRYETLSPLSGACGLAMIVLPIDNPAHPSKVLVIEVAQPVLGDDNRQEGEGLLVYTVDATVPTGHSPLVVLPRIKSDSRDYGGLYQAPWRAGDTLSQTIGRVAFKLSVLRKLGSSYNLELQWQRR